MVPVAPPGVAGFHRNAWSAALPVVADSPVTWPLALRAFPKLCEPPSVPRSVFVPLRRGTGGLRDVAFSPDGATLAAVGDDGGTLWDLRSGRQFAALSAHR